MSAEPYLEVEGASHCPKLSLGGGQYWTIGRAADNTFVFDDNMMSRQHAVIQQMQAGTFHFVDLGSRNGSSINGRRVTTPVPLCEGDVLICGETHLIFHGTAARPTREASTAEVIAPTTIAFARRLVTVLVIDIRDFTVLAQNVDEAILAQTLGTWFRETGAIVRRHGSTGDKYIGDAVMAVWTHPTQTPQADEIMGVLKAISEIHAVIRRLRETTSIEPAMRIGVGVNTGMSVLGNTGAEGNPEFSPLGDSVNVAFRLESATKGSGFDVALGQSTFNCLSQLPGAQNLFQMREVTLKGYKNPVEAWLTSFDCLEDFLRTSTIRVGDKAGDSA